MADDSRFRSTRPGKAYGSADRSARPSDDPLTELARLIGRNDPYAEFGLREQHPEQHEESDPPLAYRADDRHIDRQESLEQRDYEAQYDAGARYSADYYEAGQHEPPADPNDHEWTSDDRYGHRNPSSGSAAPQDTYAHAEHYDERDDQVAEQDYGNPAFDDADQIYDDPPRARSHGGLATALALIGCAVLGTAGAYAYRSYHGQPVAASAPPVITADTSTPTKIVPAPAGDSQAGKVIQDRVANAGREQVVSKQEEPVALKDLGTQAAPRVVLPAPVAPASSAAAPQRSSSSAVPGSNEPKKVHTLTIRPDGTDPGGPPVAALGSPARGASPEVRGSAPLSLAPETAPPPVIPAPKARTAAAPAASRPDSAVSGSTSGFLVQLASQKTEAEATASFRSLQAKYPNELAGRRPIIRRADLGTKGVFYRTMVGPFASTEEANEFCASYKAAGGHCVVPSH